MPRIGTSNRSCWSASLANPHSRRGGQDWQDPSCHRDHTWWARQTGRNQPTNWRALCSDPPNGCSVGPGSIGWASSSGLALAAWSDLPFAFAGILAVITFSVLLARSGRGRALAYCGHHSIVIYLAFPLFIGPTRVLLLKVVPMWLADMAALATTAAGVIGALLLFRLVRDTPMGFLFVRPKFVPSTISPPRAM